MPVLELNNFFEEKTWDNYKIKLETNVKIEMRVHLL